jgi:hypothetical protein
MIKNPKYKGIWKPKRIENPGYYEVKDPVSELAQMAAVAIEVWVHKPNGILFDNILIGDDYTKAREFGEATWKVRSDNEKSKQRKEEEKAKAEARKKKLAEGGFMTKLEEYTKMGAEAFAAYPWISFPGMLLFFFLIFKFCRGTKDKDAPRRRAPRASSESKAESKASKAEEEDVEEEEDDVSTSRASATESTATEGDSEKEKSTLRKRAGKGEGKKKKGGDDAQDEDEADKDK